MVFRALMHVLVCPWNESDRHVIAFNLFIPLLQLVRSKLIKRARSSLEQHPTAMKLQADLQDAYHQTETPLQSPCGPRVSEGQTASLFSVVITVKRMLNGFHVFWQAMKDLIFLTFLWATQGAQWIRLTSILEKTLIFSCLLK